MLGQWKRFIILADNREIVGSRLELASFLQRVEMDLKLDKTLSFTVEKAMASNALSGAFLDRSQFNPITANETRLGISKQLKW